MPFFNNTHINKALTNISVKYTFAEGIADEVFPSVPVKKESDVYYIYDGSNLRLDETIRANRAEANEVGHNYSTASYVLEEHALKELISDRDRDNADKPLSLDTDSTENLTEKILLRREFETVKIAFTTTSWSSNATIASAAAWDTSTSAPIADVLTATTSVLKNGRRRANRIVMGIEVFNKLKVNSSTVDRIKYTERGNVTEDILASLFDVEKVLVGMSSYDAGAEGQAASTTFLWGKDLLAYYVPKSPKLKVPSAGYLLTIGQKLKTKKWRKESRGGDMIEVSTMFLPRAVATSSAYLIKQAVI